MCTGVWPVDVQYIEIHIEEYYLTSLHSLCTMIALNRGTNISFGISQEQAIVKAKAMFILGKNNTLFNKTH